MMTASTTVIPMGMVTDQHKTSHFIKEKILKSSLLLLLLHQFSGLFSRTTLVSWYQKGKPFWILLEQEMMRWQWHHLDHMQIIAPRSRQITMPVPQHSVFTGRMPFLPPNQQHQSTEGKSTEGKL